MTFPYHMRAWGRRARLAPPIRAWRPSTTGHRKPSFSFRDHRPILGPIPYLTFGETMQTQNPFFDDLARMAGGAMGALSGLKAEIETLVRQQMERFLANLDLVPRDEFEAVRDMAAKARDRQEDLEQRLAELEARLTESAPAAAKTAPRSHAKKKAETPDETAGN